MGLYHKDYIGVYKRLYMDNRKENGSYSVGCRVQRLGFRGQGFGICFFLGGGKGHMIASSYWGLVGNMGIQYIQGLYRII